MRAALALLVAAAAETAAPAQHVGHAAPPPERPVSAPAATDPHAGHAMPAAQPEPAPPAATAADPHAGHAMPRRSEDAAPATRGDPHAGHGAPQPEPAGDPHAGHRMDAGMPTPAAPPVAPPPPEALVGPAYAADQVYGTGPMARARAESRDEHGGMRVYRFSIDLLEARLGDGEEGYAWEDVQFWYGGDIDRIWIKSEGEGRFGGGFEGGEVQALWSHALDPWFDLQAGARLDFGPGPERPHLVVGLQGLAPYWFEIDAAAFLSSEGDFSARIEGEYDLRITQRLILQPRAEAEFALQDVPELGIGSGLSSAEAGLRLRYEIVREFAPYVGIHYERAFGDAARFARAAGDDAGGWSLLVGLRAWF